MAAMLGVVDIDLNYKNLIVTTTLENIHLVPELWMSGTVYQITLWRLTLNAFKNRLDKYWTNQDVVYDYKSDLTGTGGLPVCA